jgi:hypothetical protein
MDIDSFTADGPVSFAVRVYSQTGYVSGRDLGYVPVSPESCSFTLAPGGADIWDPCGTYIGRANIVPQPAAPGTYRIMDAGDDFGGAGFVSDITIDFEDGVHAFMGAFFGAADGQCAMGGTPAPDAEGHAVFDWTVCGDAPRRGSIEIAIQGNCPAW